MTVVLETQADRVIVAGDVTTLASIGDPFEIVDLRLQSGSPAIDSGDSTYASTTDYYEQPRVDIANVANAGFGFPDYYDMGFVEVQ